MKNCRLMVALLIIGLFQSVCLAGPEFDSAVEDAAERVAEIVKAKGLSNVSAKFSGFGNLPGGTDVGFQEKLREALSKSGIVLGKRAELSFEARLVQTQPRDSSFIKTQLIGQMIDDRGNQVGEPIRCFPEITSAAENAEQSGISAHLIGAQREEFNGEKQAERFKKAFDAEAVFHKAGKEIFSSQEGLYGLAVVINGQRRQIGEPGGGTRAGLAYTSIRLGEEYGVEVINNSNHECAVELKIDGLSIFHFADNSIRKPDGIMPRFFIIPAQRRKLLSGWVMSQNRESRFQITPIQESAVARAGSSMEAVGLVTMTFYASWIDSGQPPLNEPTNEMAVPMLMPRADSVADDLFAEPSPPAASLPAEPSPPADDLFANKGSATGFGTEVTTDIRCVNRKIGVPRAVVAFRYQRD